MKIVKIKTRKSFSSNFSEMLIMNFKYLICGFESDFWIRLWMKVIWVPSIEGEITQSLKFNYLYKNHCKSYELIWVFKGFLLSDSCKATPIDGSGCEYND